jgi:hypothetical protein
VLARPILLFRLFFKVYLDQFLGVPF